MFKVVIRSYSKGRGRTPNRGTILRTKNGKKLEAPASSTVPKYASKLSGSKSETRAGTKSGGSTLPFSFGHFSGLKTPTNNEKLSSSKIIEKVTDFEELRIFPTVRLSMKEEIKFGYNMKNTYMQDKSELNLKPSPVQVAAIKKLLQPRLANLKKKDERDISSRNNNRKSNSEDNENEDDMGSQSIKILNDLAIENEKSKLKVFTIAAETGSGKTWSYLAPLLSNLKEEELELFNRSKEEYFNYKSSPIIRSLILLPTHELVEQVYDTVSRAATIRIDGEQKEKIKSKILEDPIYKEFLSLDEQRTSLNLNVVKWGAGEPHRNLVDAVKTGRVDVLVTTPSKLLSLSNMKNMGSNPFKILSQVTHCVVDEADTLMDNSWVLDTSAVIRKIPKCRDLVFCSATIPKEFNRTLSKMFPGEHSLINVVTPSLHKIPKSIHLKIIDAELSPYNGSKTRCLAQALYAIHKDGTEAGFIKRILVFVNQSKDVEPLREALVKKYGQREEDIIGITGKDSPKERLEKISPFLQPAELLSTGNSGDKIKVLIATDLLARGLNFNGIKNVILMDLPNTSVDLVHRVGRTGRMRQSGRVFVIINKKSGKSWIKGLPKVIKKGIPLG
ncbi:ATP-dependent RNA helicase Mrh4p, mitochondrial [[Candida] railenensis]|uniref:ATP-dependent RNA helicase n=1 Tax=[Candida] railenensis TaxID=45579 RepID=A0A9P0QWR0_9ASCO|nr:ATP-dependent RNA helicase Mrh4p, mitochondrial [[Candida] railenensis]